MRIFVILKAKQCLKYKIGGLILPNLWRFLYARLHNTCHMHIPLGLGDHRLWGIVVAEAREDH
jgi:hypothetical protein